MARVTDAWLRGGAGPMKDRRSPLGDRELIEEQLEELCPRCATVGVPRRAKLVCPRCHTIIETCCEGA